MSDDPAPTSAGPRIVSPVSRYIAVSDVGRSVAFYRDILGFEARETPSCGATPPTVELICGPARIQVGSSQDGSAGALFFETDNIEAMRAAVAARGGTPTKIERVNWIKMAMLEIRDPDGRPLWFGKSFAEPGCKKPEKAMLWQIMPELPLNDVPAGVAYYRDVLGFKVNYAQHDLGVMDRDRVSLLLIARSADHKGIGSAYVYVENVDDLYAELCSKGANVQGEPISQPWGLREFAVLDMEGNRIRFAQTFE